MILNFLSFPHCGDTDCDPLTRAAGFVAETFFVGDAYATLARAVAQSKNIRIQHAWWLKRKHACCQGKKSCRFSRLSLALTTVSAPK